jgi:hypothetical protein
MACLGYVENDEAAILPSRRIGVHGFLNVVNPGCRGGGTTVFTLPLRDVTKCNDIHETQAYDESVFP